MLALTVGTLSLVAQARTSTGPGQVATGPAARAVVPSARPADVAATVAAAMVAGEDNAAATLQATHRTLVGRIGHDMRKTLDAQTHPMYRQPGETVDAFDPLPESAVLASTEVPVTTPVTAAASRTGSKTADLVRQANARIAQQSSAKAAREKEQVSLQASLERGLIGARQRGTASWYADSLHGEMTANGERYDRNELTAAHQSLPLGTWVKVSRVGSQRSVLVRINDRGPFAKSRIIDLSYQAAKSLGMLGLGTAQVVMEVVTDPKEAAPPVQRVATAGSGI